MGSESACLERCRREKTRMAQEVPAWRDVERKDHKGSESACLEDAEGKDQKGSESACLERCRREKTRTAQEVPA